MQRHATLPSDTDLTFDLDRFLAVIGPILAKLAGGDGVVALSATQSMHRNHIVRLSYQGRQFGVRISRGPWETRYEEPVIREMLALSLLAAEKQLIDDNLARSVIDRLLSAPKSTPKNHPLTRPILYHDWTLSEFPYAFFIFDWVDGVVLWEQPIAEHYYAAGALLAKIHQFRFDHFYDNIFAAHALPRSWRDHLRVCANRELARAELYLPSKLTERLNRLDFSDLETGPACLIHNDFTGANILIGPQSRIFAVDWEEWLVDCPERDLVKMKYWTAIGSEGLLTHQAALWEEFLRGYRSASAFTIDERRLHALESFWLLRSFNFACSLEAGEEDGLGRPSGWRQVYPDARYYLDILQDH